LVRPPVEASIGKPVSAKACYSAHRVAVTAATSALIAGQQGWFSGEEVFERLCVFLGVAGDGRATALGA
jgi:hypothetical protein